jgi:3'(2'), 5'-bisphosphate nucleotidase
MQAKNTDGFGIGDVVAIAREAGDAIMAFRAKPGEIRPHLKGDGSPVSAADKTASALIVARLRALTPDIPVVSEEAPEDDNRAALAAERQWIVDPLDGTASFLSGHDGFGVHIALVEKGVPLRGVVYFPARDTLYYTGDDGKAWFSAAGAKPRELSLARNTAQEPPRLAVSWRAAEHPPAEAFPYAPLCEVGGGRICAVADGRADAAWMVNPRKGQFAFSCWDVAASHAVLRAAGGELWNWPGGAPVRYRGFGVPQSVGCTAETFRRLRAGHQPSATAPPKPGAP